MPDRVTYLDILRIIAIECVIWLHAMVGFIISASIYGSISWKLFLIINEVIRAGVPIFLMLSGYLALKSKLGITAFYRRRFLRILVPLLSWNIIYFFWSMIYLGEKFSSEAFLSGLFNEGHYYHMWFVYMLLGIYFVAPFLKIIIENISIKATIGLFFIIIFAQTIVPVINRVSGLGWQVKYPVFENYVGYFILGYILGEVNLSKATRIIIYLSTIIGGGLAIIGNFRASSIEGINLIYNGGYSFNHYFVAMGIFVFIKYCPIKYTLRTQKFLHGWSDIIFGVYFIHVIVLEIVSSFLYLDLSPIKVVSIYFVITSLVSTIIVWIISRINIFRKLLT
ncbi:MAG: hypothetical protein ATN31_00290 [Candidatus Epulonipiscioides saccharophilum]|nr:MAG: hypothetical protein ATN31_00290 [Epulopiscium sp. AS2M-Bin001]